MEPLAVVIILTGLALLLLVLRAGAREGEEVIERLVDGAERELRGAIAARSDRAAAEAALARIVAQLNTLGFLMLAVERRGCGRAVSEQLRPELEARIAAAGRRLAAGQPIDEDAAGLARLEAPLIRAAIQGRPDADAPQPGADALPAAVDPDSAEAAGVSPAAVPNEAAQHEAEAKIWPQIVEGCLGVERIFQAFQPEQQRERIVSLAESVSLLFQAVAPSLVLGLAAGREVCGTLAQPLARLGSAIGQELLVVHTLTDLAARTAGAEARTFAELAGAARGRLEAGLQRLHGLRRGWDQRAWQVSAEEVRGAVQAELEATLGDCRALLAMVPASEHLTVQEMMLAHPRGPALVQSLGLKCRGCVAAEVETLASAALVHDIPLEQWLAGLGAGEAPPAYLSQAEPSGSVGDAAAEPETTPEPAQAGESGAGPAGGVAESAAAERPEDAAPHEPGAASQ